MKTALLSHPDFRTHVTPEGHPERVARLEYVERALQSLEVSRKTAPLAAEDDILRVHPADYIAYLKDHLPPERLI